MDLKDFVEKVFARIQEWVEPQLKELQTKTDEVESTLKASEVQLAAKIDEVKELIPDVPSVTHLKDLVLSELPEPVAGPQGEQGEVGPAGKDGSDGRDGLDGKDGRDGKSVDIDALRELIKSEVEVRVQKEVAALPKPIDGRDGRDGRDGVDGKDGADGLNGKDGADGRDALHLDVLPDIDFNKSYPRGTFACHNGGLWRAFQKTDKQFGWDCVLDGVAEETEEYLPETRQVKRVKTYASGKTTESLVPGPGVEYRGVYKSGETYRLGDLVTWGGSIWHCNSAEPTEENPRNEDLWTLAVKKGRDAK